MPPTVPTVGVYRAWRSAQLQLASFAKLRSRALGQNETLQKYTYVCCNDSSSRVLVWMVKHSQQQRIERGVAQPIYTVYKQGIN